MKKERVARAPHSATPEHARHSPWARRRTRCIAQKRELDACVRYRVRRRQCVRGKTRDKMSQQPQPPQPAAAWKGFASGSLGAMASGAVTHPIDLVKVRMQLYGSCTEGAAALAAERGTSAGVARAAPGMFATGATVLRTEGVFGLYKGLSASLLRQASFIGTKFGAYDVLKSAARTTGDGDGKLPFWKMTMCGIGAGAIGAAVGNPADLAMVRMQADGRLPVELRRNYRNGADALFRVGREEGVFALWRGCMPTVNRAMIVTASQMAVYDQAKHYILDHTSLSDGLTVQTGASFAAGVVAALTSNPIDLAKSRLMSMKADEKTGKMPYSGTLDCLAKTVRTEGVSAVYKGLVPTVARQVPLNIVRFVSVEYFKQVFEKL